MKRSAEGGRAGGGKLSPLVWLGHAAAAVWIFGTAVYFLVHFSWVFYTSHKTSIDGAASGLGRLLGLDGADS